MRRTLRWLAAQRKYGLVALILALPLHSRSSSRTHPPAGFFSALVALLYAARRNTANPETGTGYELEVITAVVVGGASINGGRGTIVGTVLGVLLIHETREFVKWRWSSDELNLTVMGLLLIFAVLSHRLFSPRNAA